MGVLAGLTSRIKLGTSVLVVPYRNPVVTAKMLATLDVMSGGRIILGAGVGWMTRGVRGARRRRPSTSAAGSPTSTSA